MKIAPTSLKRYVLNSPVERIATPLYFRISDFATYSYPTPQGPVTLTLPTNVAFTEVAKHEEFYERALVDAMANSNFENGVFFDVGARYGFSSCAAMLCGADENKIHAFESSLLNFRILNRNLPKSERIYSFVGDGSDKTISLSDYSREHDIDPVAVKIDVEGAEQKVLEGLSTILEVSKPTLFIEVHPQMIGIKSANELVYDLSDRGYEVQMAAHHDGQTNWREYDTAILEEFLIWCQ